MSKTPSVTFEEFDAAYIARLILEKLHIDYPSQNEQHLFSPKSPQLIETLQQIEKIEHSWEHRPTNGRHTFGRKELNEVVKLWSVPQKSAQVLENLTVLTGAKKILEIGTSAGYAALHLGSGALSAGGTVFTIELLPKKIALAKSNFERAGIDNITLLEGQASQILSHWQYGAIDLVFLDADKENYGKYLDLLLPLLKIGSIIVADNINDYGHLMQDYLQRVTGTHLPQSRVDTRVQSYYLAALDNGFMITKKIAE